VGDVGEIQTDGTYAYIPFVDSSNGNTISVVRVASTDLGLGSPKRTKLSDTSASSEVTSSIITVSGTTYLVVGTKDTNGNANVYFYNTSSLDGAASRTATYKWEGIFSSATPALPISNVKLAIAVNDGDPANQNEEAVYLGGIINGKVSLAQIYKTGANFDTLKKLEPTDNTIAELDSVSWYNLIPYHDKVVIVAAKNGVTDTIQMVTVPGFTLSPIAFSNTWISPDLNTYIAKLTETVKTDTSFHASNIFSTSKVMSSAYTIGDEGADAGQNSNQIFFLNYIISSNKIISIPVNIEEEDVTVSNYQAVKAGWHPPLIRPNPNP
jgi:hypothetical protein